MFWHDRKYEEQKKINLPTKKKNAVWKKKKKQVTVAHQESVVSFSSGAPFLSPYHLDTFCFRLLLDYSSGPAVLVCEGWTWKSTGLRGYKWPPNKTHVIVTRKCQRLLLIGYFWDTRKRGFEFIQVVLEPLKIYLVTLMQVWREKQQNLWIQSCQSLDWCRRNWMLTPQRLDRNQGGYWETRA